jgi:hypothetical protein
VAALLALLIPRNAAALTPASAAVQAPAGLEVPGARLVEP